MNGDQWKGRMRLRQRPPEEMNAATPFVEKDKHKRSDETLAKPSVEEDWQGMVAPDPAFYLKDNG